VLLVSDQPRRMLNTSRDSLKLIAVVDILQHTGLAKPLRLIALWRGTAQDSFKNRCFRL